MYGIPRINYTKDFENYHLSYCYSSSGYGCPTTALVTGNMDKFYVLKENHMKELEAINKAEGLEGCFNYFRANIDKLHPFSDKLPE